MKKFLLIGVVGTMLMGISGCTGIQSSMKDAESDVSGLNRTVNVYSDDGEVLKTYTSKSMRVKDGDGGTITLDFDGKRVIICNAHVVIEENQSNK
ncbi:TPA: DUF5052 family protein [Clostridioides difficile]|nr:DUF5052 family protein [Clostridioides difficile]HBZ0256505.1 DUF5052 family protein [Clostridioides difficile]